MSNKKSNDDLKNRLRQSKSQYDKKTFENSFKMDHISGDTNIRNVKLSDLREAPKEWNFYKPLSDDKMEELVESVYENGLLHPIVVWEQEDGSYMILAGHNRVSAYRKLLETTKDRKYEKISAHIKEKEEITEEEAKEIIIDTNWVQRSLSPIEKSKSIIEKYSVVRSKKDKTGKKSRDIVAEEYGLTGRTIEEYRRLEKLIDQLKDMVNEGTLSVTSASKLALFSEEIQKWILENHREKLERKYMKNLNSQMSRKEIENAFKAAAESASIRFEVDNESADIYKKLSAKDRKEIEKAVEKLIREKS